MPTRKVKRKRVVYRKRKVTNRNTNTNKISVRVNSAPGGAAYPTLISGGGGGGQPVVIQNTGDTSGIVSRLTSIENSLKSKPVAATPTYISMPPPTAPPMHSSSSSSSSSNASMHVPAYTPWHALPSAAAASPASSFGSPAHIDTRTIGMGTPLRTSATGVQVQPRTHTEGSQAVARMRAMGSQAVARMRAMGAQAVARTSAAGAQVQPDTAVVGAQATVAIADGDMQTIQEPVPMDTRAPPVDADTQTSFFRFGHTLTAGTYQPTMPTPRQPLGIQDHPRMPVMLVNGPPTQRRRPPPIQTDLSGPERTSFRFSDGMPAWQQRLAVNEQRRRGAFEEEPVATQQMMQALVNYVPPTPRSGRYTLPQAWRLRPIDESRTPLAPSVAASAAAAAAAAANAEAAAATPRARASNIPPPLPDSPMDDDVPAPTPAAPAPMPTPEPLPPRAYVPPPRAEVQTKRPPPKRVAVKVVRADEARPAVSTRKAGILRAYMKRLKLNTNDIDGLIKDMLTKKTTPEDAAMRMKAIRKVIQQKEQSDLKTKP